MNLTLHLVRTDLRRLRAWIACWIALLLVPIALGAALLAKSPTYSRFAVPPFAIIACVQLLLGYLLTILLFQEHPVIGTTQFWLTRPISRGRLLVAKTLGALLVVAVIPVAVSLPWWLWCGFGLRDIINAGAETSAMMIAVVVCGAFMATVADSLGRALLWTFVFVAVALFVMMTFSSVIAMTVRDTHEMSLVVTRSITAILAVAVELMAAVALLFRLRRRPWPLAIATAMITATLSLAARAPWSWFEGHEPPEINPSRANGVTVRIEGAQALPPNSRTRYPWLQEVETHGVLATVPSGFTVMGVGARERWSLPDIFELSRESVLRTMTRAYDPVPGDEVRFFTRAVLPRSIVARLATERAAYDARLWFRLGRIERWFETSLGPTPWHAHGPHRFKIERGGSHSTDDVRVELVETSPYLLSSGFLVASSSGSWFSPIIERPEFFVIDHERNQMVSLTGSMRREVVNGVAIIWHNTSMARRNDSLRRGPGSAVRWQRVPPPLASTATGLSFVAAGWKTEAQFARDVKVERLEIAK